MQKIKIKLVHAGQLARVAAFLLIISPYAAERMSLQI